MVMQKILLQPKSTKKSNIRSNYKHGMGCPFLSSIQLRSCSV